MRFVKMVERKALTYWEFFYEKIQSFFNGSMKGKPNKLKTESSETWDVCLNSLDKIDVEEFQHFKIYYGSGLNIRTSFDSVYVLSQELKRAAILIDAHESLNMAFMSKYSKIHTLTNFLTTHDGKYRNIVESVEEFKTNAVRLCLALRKAKDTHSDVTQSYNARVVQPLLAAVLEVSELLQKLIKRA